MKNANSHWFECNLILCGYSHSNGMDSKPFYPLRTSITTPKTFLGSKVLMYYYNNCFGWLGTQSHRIEARSNLCTIWVTCDVWEHHKPLLASNKPLLASNKSLLASNKSLLASNKPLLASNKPLLASNKSLLASNKPLLASMQGSKKWLVGVLNHLKQSFHVYFLRSPRLGGGHMQGVN